jgi:hypothetical protein
MVPDEITTDYESKLRLWYLARLRKSYLSFELANQSTPNTLVGADNVAIRQKLLQNAIDAGSETSNSNSASAIISAAIGSFAIAGLITLLLFFFS